MYRAVILLLLAAIQPPWRDALPGYRYSFPRDHFEHPDFRTEWWYYTGNVWTADGRRFGFELVFFREGDRSTPRTNPSPWRIDDIYFAHAALTDATGRRFVSDERLNRGGPGIAGASFAQQRIWNGNWFDIWRGEEQTLTAATTDFHFTLSCSPAKPFVIEGENGVDQKSEGAGNASHYVSFPLLKVTGSISNGGREYKVSGQAWMDHEWFSSALAGGQAGWDWFSIQLDNGTEVMLYQLRRKDRSADPYSSGTFIDRNGHARHLRAADFRLTPGEVWKSPATGARYPVTWTIGIPSLGLDLHCTPVLPNQELAVTRGPQYWEGAVNYNGSAHGVGYLEMTGYGKALGGSQSTE
ncbi:lipocalin-like domain-containing protein [Nevskia soli]|uniref:lipocalin-like domain-containing protein n=1 Tax=Nevskia soli TaxID=418856 RepID=UPI0015D8713A|nr:lipocalin-like domain-containing protein [Nevskia soli]